MERYHDYVFNADVEKEAGGESWFSFLKSYFEKTKRPTRINEDSRRVNEGEESVSDEYGPIPFVPVELSGGTDNPFSALDDKEGPRVGASCTCPSIKNYDNTITISRILKDKVF